MKKIIGFVLAAVLCLGGISGFASTFTDAHGNTIELDETLLKGGIYRYFDTKKKKKAFLMLDGVEL